MQAADFNFIVLPLGVLIGILILTILILDSRKDIIKDKRIKRSVDKFIKEKADKQEEFSKEQDELDRLRETKAVDFDTYKRLSTLIRMNEKKLEETMDLLVFMESVKTPKAGPK